jgi:hypothetical protein
MSTTQFQIETGESVDKEEGVKDKERKPDDPPLHIKYRDLEQFLEQIQFFQTPVQIASRILEVNRKLGDYMVDLQLGDLPSEPDPKPLPENDGWVRSVVERVSAILFREETNISRTESDKWKFDKVVSEKIYDRLSSLSLSPYAKSKRVFSLTEELTYGIAEDVGLGLWTYPHTPEDLKMEAEGALNALSYEFQDWLVNERGGVYAAKWGNICAWQEVRREIPEGIIVWLNPDARAAELQREKVRTAPATAAAK